MQAGAVSEDEGRAGCCVPKPGKRVQAAPGHQPSLVVGRPRGALRAALAETAVRPYGDRKQNALLAKKAQVRSG